MKYVEVVHQGNTFIECEISRSLVIELIDPLQDLLPVLAAMRGELHDPRALVTIANHASNELISLQALEHAIEILTSDNQIVAQITQWDSRSKFFLR
ncbi:hypothetical protein AE618_00245 [Bosea vaviloviae]|uniref:Uncharacterized protein n=1 Tax=Bosea vaviloviae TaxID=1526658 RepID=A0A0N0MD79_9HYPH|nr:hypothetical protein AE618_00245 [Bosea vaviloviae]